MSSTDGPNQGPPTCSFCGNQHPSVDCPVAVDVSTPLSILRKKGKCYVCLRAHHLSRNCQSKLRCKECGSRHHVSICGRATPTVASQPGMPQTTFSDTYHSPSHDQGASHQTSTLYIDAKTTVLLPTAQAEVSGTGLDKSVKARVILDSCSQRSYMSCRLKESLNLPAIRSEKLMIKTFGNEEGQIQECEVVQLCLKGISSDLNVYLTAYAVPVICVPFRNQAIEVAYQSYHHLQALKLADNSVDILDFDMDILVGSDSYWNLVTGEVRRGSSGPVALNTRLGWVLSGPVDRPSSSLSIAVNYVSTHTLRTDTEYVNLDDQLSNFWELESTGIKQKCDSVLDKFLEGLTFNGERYEVRLPWKSSHLILPDNYELSLSRLRGTLRRLRQQPGILCEYDNVIKDQMQRGIVEDIPQMNQASLGKVHYLPHHAVLRRDKETTKFRVVYDASESTDGVSLNRCLHTGPSLLLNLLDILVRFHLHKIALIADIEKAFLMVTVNEEDRDALHFLWIDDISKENPSLIAKRFARVVFGVSASPFLLNGTLKHHILRCMEVDPEFVAKILQSLYVDDLSTGVDGVLDGFEFYGKAKSRMKEGGFNLRKWMSNSSELLRLMNESEGSSEVPAKSVLEENETCATSLSGPCGTERSENEHKTLGVIWNQREDTLIMRLSSFSNRALNLPATKGNVLRITASVYDPLGLISPVLVLMKILLQELYHVKKGWDEPLEEKTMRQLNNWITDLQGVEDIAVPCCYLAGVTGNILSAELHGFSDASNTAYVAVVYLMMVTESRIITRLSLRRAELRLYQSK